MHKTSVTNGSCHRYIVELMVSEIRSNLSNTKLIERRIDSNRKDLIWLNLL